MTIETSEQYEAAIERLREIGAVPDEGADHDEFFEISEAMVDYETRGHPPLKQRGEPC